MAHLFAQVAPRCFDLRAEFALHFFQLRVGIDEAGERQALDVARKN